MKRFLLWIFVKIPLALIALSVLSVAIFKWVPVWYTPLMLKRAIEYHDDKNYKFSRHWVKIEDISPEMIKCVVASEDNRFNTHNGFEWNAIKKEIAKSQKSGKKPRGCSTISQQTAKNVFTFGGRSFIRKGVESYFTFLIEKIWGKKRIMEVYLNVFETGKGIYGTDAAARVWFGTSSKKLTRRQCSLITACLPSPLKRNPAKPTNYLNRRSGQIVELVPKIDFRYLKDWYGKD